MLFLESGKIVSPVSFSLNLFFTTTHHWNLKALPDHNFTERKSTRYDFLLKAQFLMTGRLKLQHLHLATQQEKYFTNQYCNILEKTHIYTRTGVLQNIFLMESAFGA